MYSEALVLLERRELMEKVAPKGMHLVTKFFQEFLFIFQIFTFVNIKTDQPKTSESHDWLRDMSEYDGSH